MSDWKSFETLFELFTPDLKISCSQFNQTNNSPDEVASLKSAIQSIGESSGVLPAFVLAIVMQESVGCVRVWGTKAPSVAVIRNPGLLQSHDGSHSCNTDQATDGVVVEQGSSQTPCPASEITGMINDGVMGTASGPGLSQLLKGNDAQSYYRAARMYNSGSIPADGNLSGAGATASYASDVANKLLGIVPV